MSSKADILRQLLIDEGVGFAHTDYHQEWPVFVAREPDKPDNCITIYDTVGIIEGRFHLTGEVQEQYGIQIRIRSASYPEGEAKAQEVITLLDTEVLDTQVTLYEVSDLAMESPQVSIVHAATRRGALMPLGVDEDTGSLYLFTVNYTLSLL